eukprot:Nk52_evm39s2039 gene=Nk52_evmTU39s2039
MEQYREKARTKLLPSNYSGYTHLTVLFLFCTLLSLNALHGIVGASFQLLSASSSWGWWFAVSEMLLVGSISLTVGFLYCNLGEYVIHRFPLHQGPRMPKFLYKSHTGLHHHYYNYHHMFPDVMRVGTERDAQDGTQEYVEEIQISRSGDHKDWYFTLFPMYSYIFFMLSGGIPLYFFVLLLPTAGIEEAMVWKSLISSCFLLMGALYLAVYEICHSFHHKSLPLGLQEFLEGVSASSALTKNDGLAFDKKDCMKDYTSQSKAEASAFLVFWRRFLRFSRQHHAVHHHWRCMHKYNFNITFPVWDYIFGTTFDPSKADNIDILSKKEN